MTEQPQSNPTPETPDGVAVTPETESAPVAEVTEAPAEQADEAQALDALDSTPVPPAAAQAMSTTVTEDQAPAETPAPEMGEPAQTEVEAAREAADDSADTTVSEAENDAAAVAPAAPAPAKPAAPKPGAPRPAAPSPAAMAGAKPAVTPAPAQAASEAAMSFGRADADGTVYVRTPDGERKVGQYPGAGERDAIAYFARKYDEMASSAELLYQRVLQGNVSAKESADDLAALRQHIGEANVVGDLPALHAKVEDIATAVEARRQVEATERAAAREQAKAEREKIVAEAEKIAGQDPAKTQWKASGARIRELLDEWKAHQRGSAKLARDDENALWQRFSGARNSFDKNRRAYFAELESTQGEAKSAKTKLVEEAEKLAQSTDWAATAGAFKRLMDSWRRAGRAGRADDDALWARFKAAQDSFFNAKDEVSAAEDESFRGNLAVKEELLKEAQALLPVKDLDATKAKLRQIQDKWDAAGKVPRADMARIEGALRKVETAVREADEARWKKSNPEVQHRVSAFAEQLQRGVAQAQADLEKAQAGGDQRKIKAAEEALATREAWLKTALAAGDS